MSAKERIEKLHLDHVLLVAMSMGVLAMNLVIMTKMAKEIQPDMMVTVTTIPANYAAAQRSVTGLFLLLALLSLVRAVRFYKKDRFFFFRYMIYFAGAAAGMILLFFKGSTMEVWNKAATIYLLAGAVSRVMAIIRKRSHWNIFTAILYAVTILFSGRVIFITCFLLVDLQAVVQIIKIAFRRIRIDVLTDVIRKTYAAEIISGIILLTVAFSLVLPVFEPNMERFQDALWYCFSIVTTIGFGDITAVSVIGRVMSVVLGIYGIIAIALVTSIIINFYGEMKKEEAEEKEAEEEKEAAEKEGSPEEEAGSGSEAAEEEEHK